MMEKKERFFCNCTPVNNQSEKGFPKPKCSAELSKSLVNNNIIYNLNNINIPRWKDLSKVQKVELFFDYIVDTNWYAITLRFSDKFIEGCIYNLKITDFIRRRTNENFKNRLGYVPEYLFCIEFDKTTFHIHGVINSNNNIDLIKKILKTTAFNKRYLKLPEQYKLRCEMIYNAKGWKEYILKSRNHPRFDIYICREITQKTKDIYNKRLKNFY